MLNYVALASLTPHDSVKFMYAQVLNLDKKMNSKEIMELLIRDE